MQTSTLSPLTSNRRGAGQKLSRAALRCRRKFLRFYPGGFRDEDYIDLERGYKWRAHLEWETQLNKAALAELIRKRKFEEIAAAAVRIEARTNLLFSFEKMALRDALRSSSGAKLFAIGVQELLYAPGPLRARFEDWRSVVEQLPRKQTRVLTWPLLTVFGFIAQPKRHIFLKPNVTREAARHYDFPFRYSSKPSWETYASMLEFAKTIAADQRELAPRDLIDIQSFIWVQGSPEYEE